jgi:hypothetical protein
MGTSEWIVRLRVRAESVTVRKVVAVSEVVTLRRIVRDDVVHVEAAVRREQARVQTAGDVRTGRTFEDPLGTDEDPATQQQEHLAARQGLGWRRDQQPS